MIPETFQNRATPPPTTHDLLDLEFEYYLFEVHCNDRIEHEIQRMKEYQQWEEFNHQQSLTPKNNSNA
jgi:hypothetical protein